MTEAAAVDRGALGVLSTATRVLTFRASREELLALDHRHLAFGLLWTWIAGAGRYWDNPQASLLQHLGVGSLLYVFVLSGFLWAVIAPLRPEGWSYPRLLTFVTLTSPPAVLYAIPVERFASIDAARTMNVWFLAVVAAWRVALLFWFLGRLARLRWYEVIVAALLPLCCVVVGLTLLNLEHVVFNIMGGLREDPSPNADAYGFLFALGMLSMMALPVLALLYVGMVVAAQTRPRKAASPEPEAAVDAPG
jgi:hypothetical protein